MKIIFTRNQVRLVVSNAFLFLFVYTSLSKLFDLDTFKKIVRDSVLSEWGWLIVPGVPVTLLLVSALLLFRSTRLSGLFATALCMLCFSLYTGWVFLFSENLPCSCGGISRHLSWQQQLVLNLALLSSALAAIVWPAGLKQSGINTSSYSISKH